MEAVRLSSKHHELLSSRSHIRGLVEQPASKSENLISTDDDSARDAHRFGFGKPARNRFRLFPNETGFDRSLIDFRGARLEVESRPGQQGFPDSAL